MIRLKIAIRARKLIVFSRQIIFFTSLVAGPTLRNEVDSALMQANLFGILLQHDWSQFSNPPPPFCDTGSSHESGGVLANLNHSSCWRKPFRQIIRLHYNEYDFIFFVWWGIRRPHWLVYCLLWGKLNVPTFVTLNQPLKVGWLYWESTVVCEGVGFFSIVCVFCLFVM